MEFKHRDLLYHYVLLLFCWTFLFSHPLFYNAVRISVSAVIENKGRIIGFSSY